jgi:peptidoglycan hydrolase-like protein with peptidoglycan-binding domain
MKETSRFSREFEILLVDNRDQESASNSSAKTLLFWVQQSLNTLFNSSLPLSGRLDVATKDALRSFQNQQGLSATEKADPPTERRIMEELAMKNAGLARVALVSGIVQAARTKIEDWTSQAKPSGEKAYLVTGQYRNLLNVWALVLHHMAFKREGKRKPPYSQPESYLGTRAHFCILFDGRIIQLHPVSRMIWHSDCTSPGSVGVEFEGNFPNIQGKWWYPRDKKTGKITARNEDRPTKQQIDAGRFLIQYLQTVNGLREVLAHRQSSDIRVDDPGPDIWYNVGHWAVRNLGVNNGGPGFKCGNGTPLPTEWENWTDKNLAVWSVSATPNTSSSPASPSTSPGRKALSSGSVPKNHQANRYYAEKLGWDAYRMQIYQLLGFSNNSPTEDLLVEAVANWQRQNGFSAKDSDGIIGPSTWAKMKQAIEMAGGQYNTTSSPSFMRSLTDSLQQNLKRSADTVPGTDTIDWVKKGIKYRRWYVMNILINKYNFPPNGAAGIVGNLESESTILPNRIEGARSANPMYAPSIGFNAAKKEYTLGPFKLFTVDEIINRSLEKRYGPRKPGIGLAQWTSPTRRKGLFEHVYNNQKGHSILFNMDGQIDYLVSEMKRDYKPVFATLMRGDITVAKASDIVLNRFEKPGSILYKTGEKTIVIERDKNYPNIPKDKIETAIKKYLDRARQGEQALSDYKNGNVF